MVIGIIIIVIYLLMSGLMVSKKMSTFLAMTIMACLFSVISGEPVTGEYGLFTYVLPQGAVRLASTMMIVVFACWLGKMMEKTGVTQTIIKKAAEFGGDKPLVCALAISVACCLLFTTLNGTGAVTLVGTIVLPILLSIGLSPIVAASAYLCTYGIGSFFNPVWLGVFLELTGCERQDALLCSGIMAGISAAALLLYLVLSLKKAGKKYAFAAPAEEEAPKAPSTPTLHGVRGFLACMVPVVVLACTFFIKADLLVVLLIGIIWLAIFTFKGGWTKYMNMVSKAVVEGWETAAPTCTLMMAVGFLVAVLGTPKVSEAIIPVVSPVLPTNLIGLIIFICLLAPLSCYRGIFNPWGMGAGLATVFLAHGTFSIPVYFAFFWIAGRWCNIHDPASTQCIWAANFAGTDMPTVFKKQLVWDWAIAIICAAVILPIYMALFPL